MDRLSRTYLLLLGLSCLAATCTPTETQRLPDDPPASISEPHVIVEHVQTGEISKLSYRGPHGAGIVIGNDESKTYILTAGHVMKTREEPADGFIYQLSVFLRDREAPVPAVIEKERTRGLDAGIVSIARTPRRAAKVSARDPQTGEPVFVFGAPDLSFMSTRRTRVRSLLPGDRPGGLFRRPGAFIVDGSIEHGFSGGGVYNASEELVGMCYAFLPEDGSKGLCLPISQLRRLIRPYRGVHEENARGHEGFSQEVPQRARR